MFNRFKKNVFSQNGEDGILEILLKKLKLLSKNKDNWCCEFGAWDGIHGSNTFNLIKKYNFKSIYIESNKLRFKKLLKLKEKYKNIIAFNKKVSFKKKSINRLDNILTKTLIDKNFDILSIDIDSHDLEVWMSLKNFKPKIVIIEVNSSILPGIKNKHSKKRPGNSFTSTINFAQKAGYILVCHTGNCIFVKSKYAKKLKIPKKYLKNPNLLFDRSWVEEDNNNYVKNKIKSLLPKNLVDKIIDYKIYLKYLYSKNNV